MTKRAPEYGQASCDLGRSFYIYILADTDDTVAVLFDSIQQIPCSWLARDSSTTVSTDALTPTPSQYRPSTGTKFLANGS